ncbi:M15 family metallopeptidase [Mitsuaria sp. 7]|uniref:M15 family metallopeptidase n=1 Tax=Mitsuaria sp. 7 TaxID=1658665 RepID=UPI000A9C26D6|nr:M15 family metallopeptidase [Mitsuaria sp. 7]
MQAHLIESVGAAGKNRKADVESVQRLLTARQLYRGRVDGLCGPLTVDGILRFQRGFMSKPDGRVDPNGSTLKRLSAAAPATSTHAASPAARVAPAAASRPANAAASRPAATHTATSAPATSAGSTSAATPQHVAASGDAGSARALLTTLVPRPDAHTMNPGLVAVSSTYMVQSLGQPRHSYSQDCQPLTNEKLKKHIVSKSVGPFRATGLDLAVDSLAAVMEDIRKEQPAVYAALGTAGMLCCRNIRGSTTGISNHSWGTAIDLTLNGVLDKRGDSKVQVGLTLIAPIFNRHGWYWGAAFRTEDAMHFEASRSLVSQWAPRLT